MNSIEHISKITELGLYFKRTFNPKLENLGCLASLARKNSERDAKIFQKINELALDKSNVKLLKTIIPKIKISDLNDAIIKLKPDSLLSIGYKELANEILLLSKENKNSQTSYLSGNNPMQIEG